MRKVVDAGKVCECCGAVLVYPKEEEFCDFCKEKIAGDVHLTIDVFFKDRGSHGPGIAFCSWGCVFNWLRNFPYNQTEVDFITLPYISDDNSKGDFRMELIKFMENVTKGETEIG